LLLLPALPLDLVFLAVSTKRKSLALLCRDFCFRRRRNSCFPACRLRLCTFLGACVLRCVSCYSHSIRTRFLCFRMAPLYIVNVLDEVLDGVRKITVHHLERKFGVDARRVDRGSSLGIRQFSFRGNIGYMATNDTSSSSSSL
jgi:hypothetical protein